MKLAIGLGMDPRTGQIDIARILRAEALGYDSVWTAETWGTDALSPLAYVAALTKKIRLGTGIAHVDGRTPAMTAMIAQTIDALAGGGRVMLGIGTSGPQVVEGWHGRPWGKPNYRLRDNVAIMKKIWSGQVVTHEGKEIQLPYRGPGSVGLGKPLKNAFRPLAPIPVLIGAETALNTRMTGEVADGLVTMHTVPRLMAAVRALLAEGVARRTDGKRLEDLEVLGSVTISISSDVKATMAKAKRGIALYAGGFGAKEMNFHKDAFVRRGFQAEADRIHELFLAGHREEAAAAVPDEYVDEEMLIGSPERIKERFAAWRDCGFTTLRIQASRPEAYELAAELATA